MTHKGNALGSHPCSSLRRRQVRRFQRRAPSAERLTFCSALCEKWQNAILVLGVLWGGSLLVAGCDGQGVARSVSPRSDNPGQSSLPLAPSESPLNLGEVVAGGRKQRDFWLTNRTESLVEVAEIVTSCDCLTIDLPNRDISPAQSVRGRVRLDLRQEPLFTGNLCIRVQGKGKLGQVVFTILVKVAVGSE